MSFNSAIANPGRLTILTALAVEDRQDFVTLRARTKMTDGNLASHARRLAEAGMVDISKSIDGGKPVTRFMLTTEGRTALEAHVRKLLAALSQRRVLPTAPPPQEPVEETTSQAEAIASVTSIRRRPVLQTAGVSDEPWVD